MHIKRVDVKNFRLLKDVSLLLEPRTTLVVGRNNSGKTSLTELFRRLLVDQKPTFRLEDFSLSAHDGFWKAAQLLKEGKRQNEVRSVLPVIEVQLTLAYDKEAQNLGALSACIIDLDPDCCEAAVVVCFAPSDGKLTALLGGIGEDGATPLERKNSFFRVIKDRISSTYTLTIHAADPNDPTNRKAMDLSQLAAIVRGDLITAQRGLDDTTNRDRDVLGKVLQVLFATAVADSADPKDKSTAEQLKQAVEGIQRELHENISQHVTGLLPTFKLFGYPGLSDPGLVTETTFNVERLLQSHTKVRYTGVNGLTLPEAYNGLGARNLIYILLQLLGFFRTFKARAAAAGVHLVFIEEPEAHLHPQMQEVFISQIEKIVDVFVKEMNDGVPWPVQFVISTHSPHMANAAPFTAIRYFLAAPDPEATGLRTAQVKDLRDGLGGEPEADRNFLHQYLTLTRCDLFFADKAVLIEGTTERLLLPEMIKKVDAEDATAPNLASQYLTVMEVGGAYAHRFFKLLDFLELPALIITDIDPLNATGDGCRVSEGVATSNACITDWFGGAAVEPAALVAKSEAERIKGIRRLAFQIPEADGAPCGRSFEDAFMLANKILFGLDAVPDGELEEKAEALAKTKKKSAFALEHAIDKTDWTPPKYIAEALLWLAKDLAVPPPAPVNFMVEAVAVVEIGADG
ncbi:ATP-dependent endonuclease [Rhodospirillaceae bacterium SYSU D60014]|uniref:ATP-dependent nuclease n=1 Tax=Virgifigura deserti TaxID=2268457 RepID=UPI000E66FAC4